MLKASSIRPALEYCSLSSYIEAASSGMKRKACSKLRMAPSVSSRYLLCKPLEKKVAFFFLSGLPSYSDSICWAVILEARHSMISNEKMPFIPSWRRHIRHLLKERCCLFFRRLRIASFRRGGTAMTEGWAWFCRMDVLFMCVSIFSSVTETACAALGFRKRLHLHGLGLFAAGDD